MITNNIHILYMNNSSPLFSIGQRVKRIEERDIVGATVVSFQIIENEFYYLINYDEGNDGWWCERCLEINNDPYIPIISSSTNEPAVEEPVVEEPAVQEIEPVVVEPEPELFVDPTIDTTITYPDEPTM